MRKPPRVKLTPEQRKVRKDNYDLTRRYGITLEDYQQMHAQQDGGCAICSAEEKLYVDHCHSTGKVRGLLCNGCNMALGRFGDDTVLLYKALAYLGSVQPVASESSSGASDYPLT